MRQRLLLLCSIAALMVTFVMPAYAAFTDVPHPFMLWTREEAASIGKKIDTEPWAKAAYDRMQTDPRQSPVYRNLFSYLVMGEQQAGETEKKYLLSFAEPRYSKVDDRTWSDNYLSALRYDVLYDMLTPEEREKVETVFRSHIQWQLTNDKRTYTKTSWLPNMQWCRPFGMYLMAVAMKDQDLIKASFNDRCGWKYYFDDYVSDGYFYNEEFGKQYSMIGEMLLWCRGLERLGLNEMGYGYVGKGGATMRKYLESILLTAMPSIDLGTSRRQYPRMAMGDAKGGLRGFPGYFTQHAIVTGYLTDGEGGNKLFSWNNMNGRDHTDRMVEKMQEPLWFEIAQQKWPDAGFDYLLAQMRGPNDDKYYPTLYFGLDPVDPAKVKAPAAPSGVYPERGIAVLRADEGPAYWESPAPAVGLRLATPYVHEVSDEFALTGFYAFNRPIYLNRQVSPGYAGTDPGWSNSIRGHCAVVVDGQEPARIGQVPTRSAFTPAVKFVSARGKGLYPNVDQTRALFLTRDYLLDISRLTSPTARSYQWMVHTLGHACPDNPSSWAPTRNLVGTLFDVADERSYTTDNSWAVTAVQTSAGADPETSGLGQKWFLDRIGVRVTMLGEPGTTASTALAPVTRNEKDRFMYGADEPGGVSIVAARSTKDTVFAVLHEPFKSSYRINEFRRIQETEQGIAVAVIGAPESGIDDRVMMRYGDGTDEPLVLAGDGEIFNFANYAYVRVTPETVEVTGDMRAMKVRVEGRPKLIVNGQEQRAQFIGGSLFFSHVPLQQAMTNLVHKNRADLQAGPLAARWMPDMVRLTTGGKATATLKLRNDGLAPVTAKIKLTASEGVTVTPDVVSVANLPAGGEQDVPVTLTGNAVRTCTIATVNIGNADAKSTIEVQDPQLRVAQGMVSEPSQVWPRDFAQIIYSPRYVVKYYYLNSVAAALLLDPLGLRRSENQGTPSYPRLRVLAKASDGKEMWNDVKLGGFQAFVPVRRSGNSGEPPFLADMGQHPHGYRSPFEMRFTEDWIWIRYKDAEDGQSVSFDWSSGLANDAPAAATKLPAKTMYAVDGKILDDTQVRDGDPITAMFRRTAGYRYGELTLYPAGAYLTGADKKRGTRNVAQPGGEPMAFTYCTEDEFSAMVQKWQNQLPPVSVKPHEQGDVEYAKPE